MAKILVTGANGLVGSHLVGFLESQGHEVIRLQRKNPGTGKWAFFELGKETDSSVFAGVEALVHCAYDFSPATPQQIHKINVEGSLRLFQKANELGVHTRIFVSSISAFDDCQSGYGKGKLEVEKFVNQQGGLSIRPGLVFEDPTPEGARGMFGTLMKVVNLPLLPVFDGGTQKFYLVHADDLAVAIGKLIREPAPYVGKTLTIAKKDPVTFSQLLKMLAHKKNKTVHLISVPGRLGLFGLKSIEALGIKIGFRSDNLLGLLHFNPSVDFELTESLGLSFRDPA